MTTQKNGPCPVCGGELECSTDVEDNLVVDECETCQDCDYQMASSYGTTYARVAGHIWTWGYDEMPLWGQIKAAIETEKEKRACTE